MLKDNEMKIESDLFEQLPCGVLICDRTPELRMECVNPEFRNMTGFTEETLQDGFQSSLLQMVHPQDRSYVAAVSAKLQEAEPLTLEYRLQKADGKCCWVLERRRVFQGVDGTRLCLCVLVDITAWKEEDEQLRLNLERYKIITDQSNDIIFEWDFAQDSIYFSPNWKKKFGYTPIQTHFSRNLPVQGHVFAQDRIRLQLAMKKMREGTSFLQTEIRIRSADGVYLWCRLRASTQYDENGAPIRAVGMVTDISKEKAQRQQLLERAQRDALTGLLNKAATEKQIRAFLAAAGEEPCALMIVDLDHFKSVNDRFGHLCGDAVLTDASEAIRHLFRTSDIVGRIGGDEFMVFIPGIDRAAAMQKAHQMLQKMEHICLDDGGQHISCSIGISCYPEDAENFSDLYRFADRALYQVKRSGRADAALYTPESCRKTAELLAEREERHTWHAEHLYADSSQMLQEAFRLLSSTPDLPAACGRLLEFLSKWFHGTHVCVWEYQLQLQAYRAAFAWDERALPDPQQQAALRFCEMEPALCAAGPDTLFCCEDTEELETEQGCRLRQRGVCSFLECMMTDGGRRVGLLSCENHRRTGKWPQEQRYAFRQIADLLAVYLVKFQQQQSLEQLQK